MLTLLLFLTLLTPQNPTPQVFDCLVTEIAGDTAVTVCDSRNRIPECTGRSDLNCLLAIIDYPLDRWPFAWGFARKGSVVRAEWIEGHLRPVDCTAEPRTGDYKRDDLNGGGALARREKASKCSGATSAFIRELLERMKP